MLGLIHNSSKMNDWINVKGSPVGMYDINIYVEVIVNWHKEVVLLDDTHAVVKQTEASLWIKALWQHHLSLVGRPWIAVHGDVVMMKCPA